MFLSALSKNLFIVIGKNNFHNEDLFGEKSILC